MTVRADLSAALKPLLPARVKIVDVPRGLDGVETQRPVVMLYRERVEKAPNALGDYFNTFALWIVSPNVDPKRSEDQLDNLLDEVIPALDELTWLNWSSAERSTFGDSQAPAYKIELTVVTDKE
jgi:hypothetical protein